VTAFGGLTLLATFGARLAAEVREEQKQDDQIKGTDDVPAQVRPTTGHEVLQFVERIGNATAEGDGRPEPRAMHIAAEEPEASAVATTDQHKDGEHDQSDGEAENPDAQGNLNSRHGVRVTAAPDAFGTATGP
jgi:hypothetical protein